MIHWHRLLGYLLFELFRGSNYSVELEKELSLKQQHLDILILRRQDNQGKPPPQLPDGFDNLRAHNLITYKSHQETLDRWAIFELFGHFVNYVKQYADSENQVDFDNCQLYAISTRKPHKLIRQMSATQIQAGVYDYTDMEFTVRLLITSEMPSHTHNAIWQLFSGQKDKFTLGAKHYQSSTLFQNDLMRKVFEYYQQEGLFPMSFNFEEFKRELHEDMLNSLTERDIMRAMQRLPVEKRMEGVPVEKRMEGVPVKELAEKIDVKSFLKEFGIEKLEEAISELKKH